MRLQRWWEKFWLIAEREDLKLQNGEFADDELLVTARGDRYVCAMYSSGLGGTDTPHDDDCINCICDKRKEKIC